MKEIRGLFNMTLQMCFLACVVNQIVSGVKGAIRQKRSHQPPSYTTSDTFKCFRKGSDHVNCSPSEGR